jgi:hypothetical protein
MAQTGPWWLPLCGWQTQGDVAGFTIYTSRKKRLVWFPIAPPKKFASVGQRIQRERFVQVSFLWQALTDTQKQNWMNAATKARLRIHGYNLFVYYQTTKDEGAIRTIERNTGITLLT